ncbi:MAG: hypothetical protein H7Y18_02780 [Clostridiaceae bacterium]|nr:hypothetical protein [Clostridiaceae bacterium]
MPNEYETKVNITYLKISKKDGSLLDAVIDTEDLERVLAKGVWFAEWHKDFNNYLVQNLAETTDPKQHAEKQTLHSFILNVSPKAPIRHLNGNTLDNRKGNMEVFNHNALNDYKILDENTIAIILRDKYGKENGRTFIDKEDLNKVVIPGYTWVLYISKKEPYAIANTPTGRVYLNRFLLDTPEEMISHPINLNTLDNRKANLENKVVEEE